MASNHNILTWKYCHNILLEYSFTAPSDIPPRPAHTSHHQVIHQRGKPRAYHWRDCRIGNTGARTAVSMRYILLAPCGEQQEQKQGSPSTEQLCAVGVTTPDPVGALELLSVVPQGAETHQTP